MKALAARDRRALLLGGSVLGVSIMLGRGIPLWFALNEDSGANAAAETKALADARAVIAAAPALRDSLAARNARYLAMAPDLIAAATPDDAVARLSGIVSAAATNAGVALSSINLNADTTLVRGFSRPSVHGEARGDLSGLTQFLLLVEMGPPVLRVARLTVSQPDPMGAGRTEELRIAFVIDGVSLPVATREREANAR